MRFFLFKVIFCLLWAFPGFSQTTVSLGLPSTGAGSTNVLLSTSTTNNQYSRTMSIYTAAEIIAAGGYAGFVNSLAWDKNGTGEYITNDAYINILLKQTSTSIWGTSPVPDWNTEVLGATQVFTSSTYSLPTGTGWKTIPFTNNFTWNGTDNIIVFVEWDRPSSVTADITWGRSTQTSMNATRVGSTSLAALVMLVNSNRPILQLTFNPSTPCTSPPTPGTTTASVTSVCSGSPVNIALTGQSVGNGQTYQLQSSTTLTGTYTNVGTSSASALRIINPTASLYYRMAVTCGTSTTFSTPILVSVILPVSGTFTINSAVATGGTNFQNYTDAISYLGCGISGPVVFNVTSGSGPYNEQITIGQIAGASATNTIRFNGRGTTIRATPVTGLRAIITLDGADHVIFDSLTVVSQATAFGWGFHLTNGADSNTITKCKIDMTAVTSTTAAASGGIVGSGSATSVTLDGDANYNNIDRNNILGAYQGIIIHGGTGTTDAVKNRITNNTISNFYAVGIELTNADSSVIENNDISRAGRAAVTTFTGIELGADCMRCVVNANKVHDTHNIATTQSGAAYGIYANTADATVGSENKITNNLIYNFNSTTGTQYGLYNTGSDGAHFLHNTVALSHAASTAGVTKGLYQTTLATNVVIRDNIFYITRGGTGEKQCLHFNTATSAIVSNNNDLFMNAPAGSTFIGSVSTTDYATLAAWRTAAAGIYDQQSDSLNPQFTNLATGNLIPTSTLLDNRGAPVGVLNDFAGATRSLTFPDMGAYEFGVPPCAAPTNLQASGITGTSATVSWTAVPGSAGYEYLVDQTAGNPAGAGTATTSISHNASPLLPLTTYYLHVRNNCGGNFSPWVTISFTTTCVAPPATITPIGATTFCQRDSVLLIANAGAALTYQWKLGGIDIPGATNDSISILASGSYTVVVKSDTCGTTSAAVVVNVLSRADTAINMSPANGTICPGTSVLLTAVAATGNTYQWYKDGVAIPGATTNTYTAIAAGDYRALITASGVCADSSGVRTVVLLAAPVATITSSSTTFCQGSTLTLNGPTPAPGITYQWLLNGTGIAGATNNTYVANATGDYRLVLSNGTCADTSAITTLTVNPLPVATATAAGPTSFCTGGSVILNANTGTGITYRWLRNNFPITGAIAGSYTATTTGSYAVVVTNTATGCLDTSAPAIAVTLFNTPGTTLNASGSLTFCQGGSVTLNAPAGAGYTYVWYRNTAIIAGATNASYTATTAGTYNAVVTNGPCVSTTISRTVVVNPLPTATITASGATAFCTGGSVILNANTGTGLTYQWRLNTTNIPGATSAAYTATASGGYTVVVSNGTCTNTSNNINVVVSTQPLPVITSVGAPTFCQGNSVTLQATTGVGYTYQWMLNTVNIPGATAATLSATATGNYTVTITNGTCVAISAPFAVSVTPAPPAVITPAGPTSFCQGGNVVLNANRGTGYTYQWTVNSAPIPGATGFTHTAYTTGNYGVNIFDGTCPATSPAVSVTVNDFPTAIITVIGADMSTGTFASYQWYRNGVLIPGATAQNYTAVRDGFYSVVVTDALGCSATSPVQQITALDVNNVNIVAVKLYPNPVENTLNVEAARAVNISIHAIDGKQLLKADRATSIDLSALAQGLYMVRITDAATGTLIRVDKVNKK